MNISIFVPCCVDQFTPATASNLVKLLEGLGHTVEYVPEQTCCGRLLYDNGNWDEAKAIGEKFIDDFKHAELIVSCSTSCVGYLKNNFGKLFFNTINHNSCKQLRDKIMDISEFLVSVERKTDLGSEFPHKVCLHSNCRGLSEYNVEEETKLLLQGVTGLELTNDKTDNFCCGFGGTFSIYNEPVSTTLAKKKVEKALAEGAEYIVSNDASCLMHLQTYIDKHKINLKTIHLVDLLMHNK